MVFAIVAATPWWESGRYTIPFKNGIVWSQGNIIVLRLFLSSLFPLRLQAISNDSVK